MFGVKGYPFSCHSMKGLPYFHVLIAKMQLRSNEFNDKRIKVVFGFYKVVQSEML